MKKILLLPFLLLLHLAAFAQYDAVITTIKTHLGEDEVRTFAVREMNIDTCIKKLTRMLGTPANNTTGEISWKH